MIRVQSKPKESAQLAFAFPKLKPSQVPAIARRLTASGNDWPTPRKPAPPVRGKGA